LDARPHEVISGNKATVVKKPLRQHAAILGKKERALKLPKKK